MSIPGNRLLFGGFSFDPQAARLWKGSAEVVLRPKTLALLGELLACPGEVLSKHRLMDAIWPEVVVGEDSLTKCVSELRDALGDSKRQVIGTVPRRGYVLLAPVEEASQARASRMPALAVARLSGAMEEPGSLDDFADDLIAALSLLPDVRVVAGGTGQPLTAEANLRKLALDLGVRYLLTLRGPRRGGSPLACIQLVEGSTATVLWNDRFDLTADASPCERAELASSVASLVAGASGAVVQRERARLRRSAASKDDPWELCARAGDGMDTADRSTTLAKIKLAERAIEIDPSFASGWLLRQFLVHRAVCYCWLDASADAAPIEEHSFRRAVELDPADPRGPTYLALSRAKQGARSEAIGWIEYARDRLGSQHEAAVELSLPLSAVAGDADQALRLVDRARDKHHSSPGSWGFYECRAAFLAGRHERALGASHTASPCLPRDVFRALSAAMLGDEATATESWQAICRDVPQFDFGSYAKSLPIIHPEAADAYKRGCARLVEILARRDEHALTCIHGGSGLAPARPVPRSSAATQPERLAGPAADRPAEGNTRAG